MDDRWSDEAVDRAIEDAHAHAEAYELHSYLGVADQWDGPLVRFAGSGADVLVDLLAMEG